MTNPTPFGERLKREREYRGVSLEEITKATRIKVQYLQALENEDWDRLPGGAFNRGFIRSIARFLGMDEDSILAEYSIAHNAPSTLPAFASVAKVSQPLKIEAANAVDTRVRNAWLMAATTMALLILVSWFGVRTFLHGRHASANARGTAATRNSASTSANSAAPGASEASIIPIPKPDLEQPVASKTEGATGAAPSSNLPEFLELKVEAGKFARLRILADHRLVYTGHISPGDSRRYRARNNFEIFSSDSGAVLIELEGQTMPPLGPSGQPGRATFTRRDVEAAAGGAH